ncbi:DMT family transporter [Pseudoroseomonas cervicalis]|uniref:DMT family transporter n=1 Tax=Teichococcus cervicalis TaxID=204525 RepID=UPI0022F1839C|nr:DMT family transporter [Pseudoroseomonas cervicalis]WBV42841.1 DMT family transporter [Pseudoroseomonas cervicalis]
MLTAYAQLAASMALVGANVGVAKLLAGVLPIALIVGLRCLLACLVLWPLARAREGRSRPSAAALRNLAAQAALGTLLYNAALLTGLRHTTALEAGLVLATLPAVIALGSALWLRERLPPRQWAAAALAGFGMAALTLARLGQGEAGGSLLGNALVFVAVCGEATYVLLAKRLAGRVPVVTASFWMQAFSTLLLLPFCLPVLGAAAALAEPATAGLLVFHSLTASVLCLLLWYAGMKRAPAGVAGIFTALLPASAALVAVALLGESFSGLHGLGLGLMLGSIALATWPRRGRQGG